ncbi:hypothetical protein J4E08_05215 [Sagittula sp. NFXS13]|uniref:hypothetical protein n=1 Tax=Sagittula sp. NFXS13 TaxID=2819095 RepID=UPI0032DE684C
MPDRIAWLHLYPDLIARVQTGKARFLCILIEVLRARGWQVELRPDTPGELAEAVTRPGYSLVRMISPPTARGLTFRRAYLAPFWNIERCAERWDWPVAQATFDPAQVNPRKAARLMGNLRHRHFPDVVTELGGYVLMPLQGRLLEQRSFQTMSPIAMIDTVLEHDSRPIRATLHPREVYSEAEMTALDALTRRFPRLTVSLGGSEALLPGCDYVATQNSAVAVKGYMLGKPAVMFGQSDVAHIAARVHDLGAAEALRQVQDMAPDFAAYLWWRLRDHAIDDSRPDADARIAKALCAGGWPVEA